jgi:ATP-dependent DNA helicase RecG
MNFKPVFPLTDMTAGKVGPSMGGILDGETIQDTDQDAIQVTLQDKRRYELLRFCSEARTRDEMQAFVGIKNRSHFRIAYLNPLLENGKLKMTIPDKPTSRNQKYIATSQK